MLKIAVGTRRWNGFDAATLARRILDARQAHRGTGTADDTADAPQLPGGLLQRGNRSLADWVTALRGMGAGANVDHRTAPVDPVRFWHVVEDPDAPAAARAAAAVALGTEIDEPGRTRLRAAAKATAAPKLRIALEAAAAARPDDEALLSALAEIEETPSPQVARRVMTRRA